MHPRIGDLRNATGLNKLSCLLAPVSWGWHYGLEGGLTTKFLLGEISGPQTGSQTSNETASDEALITEYLRWKMPST